MVRRIYCITRPLAIALAIFTFLNLSLALQNPLLSATGIWLNVQIPEPELSVFSALLGIALLLPHDWGRISWMRWLLAGVLFGFWILVGANVIAYYHQLHHGYFKTDLPVPLSLFVFFVLFLEITRICWWGPVTPKIPLPAWCFANSLLVVIAFFGIILVHIVTFGHTDLRREADAAVILGAKVYDDGELCAALRDRLETGIELFKEGWVPYLIMSGGVGTNGISEARAMRRYAVDREVPASRIILDEQGNTTVESARNCGRIARENGFDDLLTVSQYFHCARLKLTFERAGAHCYTVPTCSSRWSGRKPARLSREDFFLFREAVAFPFYFLYYR